MIRANFFFSSKEHNNSKYFSLQKVSYCLKALVTAEIKISDLKDGILCKPKMSQCRFVNASSRGSISIPVGKLYVLTILQFKP